MKPVPGSAVCRNRLAVSGACAGPAWRPRARASAAGAPCAFLYCATTSSGTRPRFETDMPFRAAQAPHVSSSDLGWPPLTAPTGTRTATRATGPAAAGDELGQSVPQACRVLSGEVDREALAVQGEVHRLGRGRAADVVGEFHGGRACHPQVSDSPEASIALADRPIPDSAPQGDGCHQALSATMPASRGTQDAFRLTQIPH